MIYIEQKNCKLQEVKWQKKIYGKQRLFVGYTKAKQRFLNQLGRLNVEMPFLSTRNPLELSMSHCSESLSTE